MDFKIMICENKAIVTACIVCVIGIILVAIVYFNLITKWGDAYPIDEEVYYDGHNISKTNQSLILFNWCYVIW